MNIDIAEISKLTIQEFIDQYICNFKPNPYKYAEIIPPYYLIEPSFVNCGIDISYKCSTIKLRGGKWQT
jgi:hypothetical protein